MAKQKLLVVEDDAGVQKQLRWSLDRYEVLLAAEREARHFRASPVPPEPL